MKKLLFLFLLVSEIAAAQALQWPEITKENKPWTRWWWPGSIVTAGELTAAMEKYSSAGLGGLEITAIYGVRGRENEFIRYLSPEWLKMFSHTLSEGNRLGLGIDLANASGWPFGGPWVSPDDACRNINYKTWKLKSGSSLGDKVEFIQQPLVRAVGQKPDITNLKDPINLNNDLHLYALDQIRFEKPLPLILLMAYSDSGEVVNLTRSVNENKILDWTAPPGNWTLYALFQGWHGKQVERAGPGGEGDVIDHFSGKAVTNYLEYFDKAFVNQDLKYLRGYFNDSYEVDDASGQADWTNDLLHEFRMRRGYDLSFHLPALFQQSDPDANARVLSDYRQTVSDLILEKFTMSWTSWAHKQGRTTRNQAHGSPGNILDLYAASDIPETEGYELTKIKFATSAANVSGKRLVSAEAATWLNEHFISSLSDVRKAVDLFFIGGVNHVFYHGTCFSPQEEPWPGFLFYAATEFTPANSFWVDLPQLNKYIARVQSFMQSGKSDNDILLYFPIYDRYADKGRGMLEHFDAISPAFSGSYFKTSADELLKRGYAFDYVSDLQLKNTETADGMLLTQGNRYKTLIIPSCRYVPLSTFAQILKLANDGATVIFAGGPPGNISGYFQSAQRTELFNKMKQSLVFESDEKLKAGIAKTGKGRIISGDSIADLLALARIRREPMTDAGLEFSRRRIGEDYVYFIRNQSEKDFSGWLQLATKAGSAAAFNPGTDATGLLKARKKGTAATEVYIRIKAGESIIARTFPGRKQGMMYEFYDEAGPASEITGKWKVQFTEGGPVLPASFEISRLVSWTEAGNRDTRDFSGSAVYSIQFKKPALTADAWLLELGKVFNSVQVTLNGEKIATLIGPHYSTIIGAGKLKDNNLLELRVTNLMANRIAYLDRNGIKWKKFYNINMAARLKENNRDGVFDASSWKPLESGLAGPVTITPVKLAKLKR